MQNTLKPILIILAIVALVAVGYVLFLKPDTQAPLTRTSADGQEVDATAQTESRQTVQEFQTLLNQLSGVSLEKTVFALPQYGTLIDHTQTALLKLEQTRLIAPAGKPDPFQSLDVQASVQLQATPVPAQATIPARGGR